MNQVFYPGLPSHPDHELAKRVFSSGAEFAAAPPNGAGNRVASRGSRVAVLRRAGLPLSPRPVLRRRARLQFRIS